MQGCAEVLESLPGFVGQLDLHKRSNDVNLAERLLARGEEYLELLNVLRNRFELDETFDDVVSDLWCLLEVVQRKLSPYVEIIASSSRVDADFLPISSIASTADGVRPGHLVNRQRQGRPKIFISRTQIESLFELGFTFARMAKMLSISERTLQRRRTELGLPVGRSLLYSPLSDQELDRVIESVFQVGIYIIISTVVFYYHAPRHACSAAAGDGDDDACCTSNCIHVA